MVKKTTMMVVAAIVTATALVIGASSFEKKSDKPLEMLTFVYTPPASDPQHPYLDLNVKDVENWTNVANSDRCDDIDSKACRIFVPNNSTYVGAGNTLKPAINITTGGSSSESYVASTAAGSGTSYVSNKSQ